MPIQFNDQSDVANQRQIKEKGMRAALIRYGLVKNTHQADLLLIATLIFCGLILAITLWPESKGQTLTPLEIDMAGSVTEIDNN